MCVHGAQELTEEQELALALQMSLQGAGMSGLLEQAMETETTPTVATDGGEVCLGIPCLSHATTPTRSVENKLLLFAPHSQLELLKYPRIQTVSIGCHTTSH